MKIIYRLCLIGMAALFLLGCGFHLQGDRALAPPLHRLYVQSQDPYGYLTRHLKQYLKMAHVQIVDSPAEATTQLVILRDEPAQELLSVSGTQQTRQYNLKITVVFQIMDRDGRILVDNQHVSETRTITIQSNQILGSSNEVQLFYQQMRRALAADVINRLASQEVTDILLKAFAKEKQP